MTADARSLPSGFDPLIAEAKRRMRLRRGVLALLVLIAAGAVLTLILRPTLEPGPIRVTFHTASRNPLARINVPVDATEREWRIAIKSASASNRKDSLVPTWAATALTSSDVARLHTRVAEAVAKTGAAVVRMSVWPRAGAVEMVLAMGAKPAEYLKHRLPGIFAVSPFWNGWSYFKIVDGTGSSVFEWSNRPGQTAYGSPYHRLWGCAATPLGEEGGGSGPPPCPVK
jgi:hypothetical protein